MSHAIEEIRDRADARTGRFAIQARLGSGGMGEVYLAEDSLLKRPVAMKAIRSEHREDTSYLERLLREAERASQLNDEHIAAVYDVVNRISACRPAEAFQAARCGAGPRRKATSTR
jgi:hypothetical protein